MASNYTEHYQLPLWEPEDSFLREEFNEANRKIDGALGSIPKIRTGMFTGTGEAGLEIDMGFQPKFVILMGYFGRYHLSVITEDVAWLVYDTNVSYDRWKTNLELTETGLRFVSNTYNQKGYDNFYIAVG